MSTDYRIFETRQFEKDIESLTRSGRDDLVAKLREIVYPQLRERPHFGPHVSKLKGYSPETWRHRIGAWRFFYEIDEDRKLVLMIAAAHRGSAY